MKLLITRPQVGDLYHWYGMGYTDCALETGVIPPRNCPGMSCIKIGLPGKEILSKRKGLREVIFS